MLGGILRWCITLRVFLSPLFYFCITPRLHSPLPGAAHLSAPTVFAMNTFRGSLLLWRMIDEDCMKSFTFTDNAFPLTHSYHTLYVYILHFNGV